MRTIFSLIILILFVKISKAQSCTKFKIESIDSITFNRYVYFKAIDGKGVRKTIFYRKDSNSLNYNVLKVGSSYLIKIEELNRDSLAESTPNPRGLYGLSSNGIVVLEFNEVAYILRYVCKKK